MLLGSRVRGVLALLEADSSRADSSFLNSTSTLKRHLTRLLKRSSQTCNHLRQEVGIVVLLNAECD